MQAQSDRPDVAIVGAGAAGIAAARRLVSRRRSVLLVEALPRLGGRAHTAVLDDMPLDLGCGWLHSAERNPLAMLAEAQGRRMEHGEGAWRKQLRNIRFSVEEQRAAWAAYEAFVERASAAPPASDCAGDAMPRSDPWRPFVDALSSYINGVELDRLSIADFLAYDEASSEKNWRLYGGYGDFIADLAHGLPTTLETHVSAIDHDGDEVVLETDRGPIRARAAIVAVSTTVLAKGAIRFSPAVDDHLQAASRLPLGLADKVFLTLAEPESAPIESHLLGRIDRAETASYYLRPLGRPVVECFLGGAFARSLEEAGEAAATDFVLEELRGLMGGDFVKGLSPLAVTRWAHEPTIGGSYSHALPGHADARKALATPVSERLCFAGEACSTTDYSTAHGAWQTGLAAAEWIDRSL